MVDIFYKWKSLIIENSDKKWVDFNTDTKQVTLDWFDVSFPGEYEKSNILVETKEYLKNLFYHFLIDWKHLVIITEDSFEMKEEVSDFFGDVDILVIVWTKEACKIFENIETRVVIPYWEWKDIFLNNLGQHSEEVSLYKQRWELPFDTTEFVNLKLG